MAAVLNLRRRINRIRHARGFGIHSPFAFRFITEVIHQRYAYYAYARIPNRLHRLIFRVVVDLRPHRVAIYGTSALAKVVKAADSHIHVTPHKPDFIIADATVAPDFELFDGASVLIFNATRATADRVKASLKQGMTFSNGHGVLIAVNRNLPRQDFDLNF